MSANESELSSFQITVSVLGPGACEILYTPLKSEVFNTPVSYHAI